MSDNRDDNKQDSRSSRSAGSPLRKDLLIPASASVALAFGGAGCDGESRLELYERVCEKFQECNPEYFTPGESDDFFASVEECAAYEMQYFSELAESYTSTAECYEALLDVYDCSLRAYADAAGCYYYYPDAIYYSCENEYEDYLVACVGEDYEYYE
jgi:hypothetical protein